MARRRGPILERAAQIVAEQYADLPPAERLEKLQAVTTQLELEDAEKAAKRRPKTPAQREAASRTLKGLTKEQRARGSAKGNEVQAKYDGVKPLSVLFKERLAQGATSADLVDTHVGIALDRDHPLCSKALDMILDRTEGKVPLPVNVDMTIEVARVQVVGATEAELAAIKQFEGPILPLQEPPGEEPEE